MGNVSSKIGTIGYRCGLAAAAATLAFVVAQTAQLAGVVRYPLDEVLIYGTSLCIVIPFMLEMLALHHLTEPVRRFWTHGALLFTVVYAVFVVANYVVQLATVIPARQSGAAAGIEILEQTPHSLFWNFDAIGYISMGLATLMAVPALRDSGLERFAKWSLLAHALVAPLFMTSLALTLRKRTTIAGSDW